MRLAFILYVIAAAATFQELSDRLSSIYQDTAVALTKHMAAVDVVYQKAKRRAQDTLSSIVDRIRGREKDMTPKDNQEAALHEEFQRKINEIIRNSADLMKKNREEKEKEKAHEEL